MASIDTTDRIFALGAGNANTVVRATATRKYVLIDHGSAGGSGRTGLWLWVVDSGTPTALEQVAAATVPWAFSATRYLDGSAVAHLGIVYAGQVSNSSQTIGLFWRRIGTNVDSGTPGSLSTETTIDAGGTNLACARPVLLPAMTPSNPRVWVALVKGVSDGGQKWQSQLLYARRGGGGSAPDGAHEWNTISGYLSSATSWQHDAVMCVGTIGGNTRLCMVVQRPGTNDLASFVFDPNVASPAVGSATAIPGTALSVGGWGSSNDRGVNMSLVALAADSFLLTWTDTDDGSLKWKWTADFATWATPASLGGYDGWLPRLMPDGAGSAQVFYMKDRTNLDDAYVIGRRLIDGSAVGNQDNLTQGTEDASTVSVEGFSPMGVVEGTDAEVFFRTEDVANYQVHREVDASVTSGDPVPSQPVANASATPRLGEAVLAFDVPAQDNREIAIRVGATGDADIAAFTDGTLLVDWTSTIGGDEALAGANLTYGDARSDGVERQYGIFTRDAAATAQVSAPVVVRAFGYSAPSLVSPLGGFVIEGSEDVPVMLVWAPAASNGRTGQSDEYAWRVLVALATDPSFSDPVAEYLSTELNAAQTGPLWAFQRDTDGGGSWAALPSSGRVTAAQMVNQYRVPAAGVTAPGSYIWQARPLQGVSAGVIA